MVAQTADQAVSTANRYTTCDPGMCLKYTRTWLDIASLYGSAAEAWAGAAVRHAGDRNPPKGAPVFYSGGQHGHIALSVGEGKVRTTDRPSSGVVSTVALDDCERAWGYPYLGWTADLNGVDIPYLATTSEDDDVAHIESISQNAANVIGKAVNDYYQPGGVNLSGHIANIDANTKAAATSTTTLSVTQGWALPVLVLVALLASIGALVVALVRG